MLSCGQSKNSSALCPINLIKEIMLDIETSEKLIKIDNVYLIYGILKRYCLVDDMTKQAHVEGINEK